MPPPMGLQNMVDICHMVDIAVCSAMFNTPPIWGVMLPCRQLQTTKQRDPPSFSLYPWQPGLRHRARSWQPKLILQFGLLSEGNRHKGRAGVYLWQLSRLCWWHSNKTHLAKRWVGFYLLLGLDARCMS